MDVENIENKTIKKDKDKYIAGIEEIVVKIGEPKDMVKTPNKR